MCFNGTFLPAHTHTHTLTKTHDRAQVANLLKFLFFPISAEVLIGAADDLFYSTRAETQVKKKKKQKKPTGVKKKTADCWVMSA